LADPDGKTLNVTDEIEFVCRKVGDDILEEVRWTTHLDEITEVTKLALTLTKPNQAPNVYSCSPPDLNQPPGVTEHLKLFEGGHGCTLQLLDYKGCDGLKVVIRVIYKVLRGRAFSWTMPCLSNGFRCTINFPTDFDIFVDPFGIDSLPEKDAVVINNGTKVYSFDYQNWLLPDDGFAFSFSRFAKSGESSNS
jgi:hypothetical protein